MIKLMGIVTGKPKMNEATEVELGELPIASAKKVLAFAKIIGGKHSQIFDGIHGLIVDIEVSPSSRNYRFDASTMKKLLGMGIRWVEADGDIVSIGF